MIILDALSCVISRRQPPHVQLATIVLKEIPHIMKFCLEVGEVERNLVEYAFNQLFGQLCIRVNQQQVRNSVRLFDEPLTETHTLEIGKMERITVRIEKERKLLFGQRCLVFVNNRLYKCFEGV